MNRNQQLIAKGQQEYAKAMVMYEAIAAGADEIAAEGAAAMANIVRGWAADDRKCAALGFKCGA